MRIDWLGVKGTWRQIADAARVTIWKGPGTGEPTSSWKRRILMAEHSPIRKLLLNFRFIGLKYWISTHFVRHKFGIEHWVSTQRDDRTGKKRGMQDSPVNHEIELNAQALINISRKRLCRQAHKETREAWEKVIEQVRKHEPELAACCVPECVYRNGFCPEYTSCGFVNTPEFKEQLNAYLNGFKHRVTKYYKEV